MDQHSRVTQALQDPAGCSAKLPHQRLCSRPLGPGSSIPRIMQLQTTLLKKLSILGVFMLAFIILCASIARMVISD